MDKINAKGNVKKKIKPGMQKTTFPEGSIFNEDIPLHLIDDLNQISVMIRFMVTAVGFMLEESRAMSDEVIFGAQLFNHHIEDSLEKTSKDIEDYMRRVRVEAERGKA